MPHRASARDVRRIAKDPEAHEAFYRTHVDRVQRFVARRAADPYLVADLTAEVFLAAIESAHTYRSRLGDPGNWLYGIARNVVAAEVRTNARQRRAASRISGRALVRDDDVADLLDRIDAQARARELYQALDRLREADRALLELVAVDGLSVPDAARFLRISPVAARVRLHRARGLLQDRLARSSPILIKEAVS